ncbi:MAG: hypothetical protein ABIP85_24780 [Chthoniobacteraceae bacterium]
MKFIRITTIVAALAAASITTTAFAKDSATAVPKGYPLKKCPVSDEKLGEHGKPVKVTYEGTDVWLCCKSCIKDFNKEPAKFVKIVKDAKK